MMRTLDKEALHTGRDSLRLIYWIGESFQEVAQFGGGRTWKPSAFFMVL